MVEGELQVLQGVQLAKLIGSTAKPTLSTVRGDAGVSQTDAGKYLKERWAERDSAGSKIAATPTSITVQALRLAGTV